MSWVDDIRITITRDLDRTDRMLAQIERQAPDVIRRAVQVYLDTVLHLPIVPFRNPVSDAIIARVEDFVRESRTMVSMQRVAVQYMGSPDDLRAARDAFGSQVGDPATALAQRMVAGNLETTDPQRWNDGDASSAYVRKVDGRDDATQHIAELSGPIASSLGTLADAIETYYIALAALVASIVILVAGVVAAILGIVAAVPTGGVTLAAAIAGLIASLLGIAGIIVSALVMNQTADQATKNALAAMPATIPAWPAVLH